MRPSVNERVTHTVSLVHFLIFQVQFAWFLSYMCSLLYLKRLLSGNAIDLYVLVINVPMIVVNTIDYIQFVILVTIKATADQIVSMIVELKNTCAFLSRALILGVWPICKCTSYAGVHSTKSLALFLSFSTTIFSCHTGPGQMLYFCA